MLGILAVRFMSFAVLDFLPAIGLTITFLKDFVFSLWLTSPILLSLAVVITILGRIAGKKEGWSRFDSFY